MQQRVGGVRPAVQGFFQPTACFHEIALVIPQHPHQMQGGKKLSLLFQRRAA